MRRPTRPQRPALVAGKLIVLLAQGICKLFSLVFIDIFAFLRVLPTAVLLCNIMPVFVGVGVAVGVN